MLTIFHFAALSRCSRLPRIEPCEDVSDCLVPVIFIRTRKWHIKLQTPQCNCKTQERAKGEMVCPKHSAAPTYCASDQKKKQKVTLSPSAVAVGCSSGFTHSLGATSQTVDATPSFADPPCVTFTFDGCHSFQFCRTCVAAVGKLIYGPQQQNLLIILNIEGQWSTHFQTIEGKTV